jgi:kumamolisin
MKNWKAAFLAGPLALGLIAVAPPNTTATAAAKQNQVTDNAQDLGPTAATKTMTASIIFKVQNQDELEQYIRETVTPGSHHFRQFLSVDQFRSQYAPSDDELNQAVNYLQQYGLHVDEVYPNHLLMKVTGTAAQFNAAFDTDLHEYAKDGKHFTKPKKTPKVPDILANSVLVIVGLNTEAQMKPMHESGKAVGDEVPSTASNTGISQTGVPGYFTVKDVANMYNVNPLYQKGITGKGQTIGIVTLANFKPHDAYAYWDAVGVSYKRNRITQIHVDGGGPFGSDDGSGETSLDVEQSGGLAPDANILVYDAPNTDAGFMDVFYKAISDNRADTISVSWGLPEIFYMPQLNDGVDFTNELKAFHQVFMEAAAQGISLFAAAGDSGAYDTNRELPYPSFSKTLSVDAPASDPYITAAGGTTAAGTIQKKYDVIQIPQEQAWGEDYQNDYLVKYYGDDYKDAYFSDGTGGGVSSLWKLPWYQHGVDGTQKTEPDQSLEDLTTQPPTDYLDLPANFAGRNLPDLSMNADWATGYWIMSSTDGGFSPGWGGTSFVAPQLNGITALINQYNGGRVGFLNPTIYRLMQFKGWGKDKPFNDITAGDNWFYHGVPGYDQASGIGTPNVANLAEAIKSESQ